MRLQKYVKPFEYDGRGFLFNQIYSRVYEIPYGAYYLIKKNKFNEVQQKYPDLYTFLTSNNVIVVDNFNDFQYIDYTVKQFNQRNNNNNNLGLTIAPTLNCNFKCTYCYEERAARQVLFMNKETSDNVINFIRHQIGGPNASVFISWYGGEPLLAMNTIYYISQELKKLYGNRLNASITTNGFLLTEKVAKMLQESNVTSAQITVDGLKETHDERRPFIGGNVSSFDTIINNIKHNAKYLRRIDIRANIDKQNEEEIPLLFEYLRGILPNNVYYYASRTRLESPGTSFPKEYYYKQEEYADFMCKNPGFNALLNVGYGCGATNPRSYVIDPRGDLFKCWHEVGQPEKKVGDVFNGITNWDRNMRWLSYGTDMLSNRCKQCSLVGLCFGGLCPYRVAFPAETFDKEICIPAKYCLDDLLIRRVILNQDVIKVGFPQTQQNGAQVQQGNVGVGERE